MYINFVIGDAYTLQNIYLYVYNRYNTVKLKYNNKNKSMENYHEQIQKNHYFDSLIL